MMEELDQKNDFKLTYNFTSEEISVLAKFLRDNQSKLPKGLEFFYKSLEDAVYNCLSVEEVRNFYS